MAYDANPAATHDPTTGVVVPTNWLDLINANFAYLGAAWTSFSPTWTGTGTNPAILNGTLTGAYRQIGKTLHVRYYMLAGSTTTFGTGNFRLAIPNSLTVSTSYPQLLNAVCYDSSASTFYVAAAFCGFAGMSATIGLRGDQSAEVGQLAPFTWAQSDYFVINGTLEVA